MSNESLSTVINKLTQATIATVHKDPDVDAIGSLLALNHALKQFKKPIILYANDFNLKKFKFLPGAKHIKNKIRQQTFNHAIFLDCSDKSRIHLPDSFPTHKETVNIDHHQDNTKFGDINIVKNISSVGELLFEEFTAMNLTITKEIASNLYAAIMFDTGGLRFSNTTPKTLMAISQLITHDIDTQYLNDHIFDQKPPQYFEDIKAGLNHLHLERDLPVLIVKIPLRSKPSHASTINFFRQYQNKEVEI